VPFHPPTADEASHNVSLDVGIELTPKFASVVEQFATDAHDATGLSLRKDALAKTKTAVSVLCCNLLLAHRRDPNLYVAVPLGNGRYPQGVSNPLELSAAAMQRAKRYLEEAHPPFVERRGGNNDPDTGKGYFTRLRATERLVVAMEKCLSAESVDSDPQSIKAASLFNECPLPVIRIKKGSADDDSPNAFIPEQPDSDEVRRMEANLNRYNAFLADHWIDLMLPDADFDALQKTSKTSASRYFGDGARQVEVDLIRRRKLHRVFNDGDLRHGGRFYGGWWQNIPSKYRKAITINGHPTVEADFSAMQLNMLYAMEGLPAPADSYALDGFPPEQRALLKETFFRLVNAKENDRMQTPLRSSLPEGWTWTLILDGLRETHAPIAKHFRTGIGIELQRIDSDIAEMVMMRLMSNGLLALPVHDSFIVWDGKQNELVSTMRGAYMIRMRQQIGVKVDTTWMDENVPPDAHELHEDGVRFLDDFQADAVEGDEFQGWRQRLDDFVAVKGEDWGYRHSFFR